MGVRYRYKQKKKKKKKELNSTPPEPVIVSQLCFNVNIMWKLIANYIPIITGINSTCGTEHNLDTLNLSASVT